MRKFLLFTVLLCGCGFQPTPLTRLPQQPGVEAVVVEKTDRTTNSDNAAAMKACLKEYPPEVRQSVADVLPELANYIREGHAGDATKSYRLITRSFADHPVLSAQPMHSVAVTVNKALLKWSKPASMPEDWQDGMADVLQELADGAAASVK